MVAMTMILRASYLSIYIGLFFGGSSCRNASACPSPPDHAAAAADEEVRAQTVRPAVLLERILLGG
jgi:hypothetical protein